MIALLSASVSFAQFKATPDGVATEDGKDFYVATIPNISSTQLYDATNAWVMKNFKNPNAVASKEPGKMISIHGVFTNAFIAAKRMLVTDYADVDLNITIYFKDEKIRFDIPQINNMRVHPRENCSVTFSGGINVLGAGNINMFKKNGKENKPELIAAFNSFINGLVVSITEQAKSQDSTNW